jgi:Rrf2 family protein
MKERPRVAWLGVTELFFMILKVTSRHAVCAAIYLAEYGVDRTVTAAEISRNRDLPLTYLPRILGKMAKAGIIESYHGGREKGYRMKRDVYTISLYEVFDLFEGWSMEGCLLHPSNRRCDCPAQYHWKAIEERMFEPLKNMTLGDICKRNIHSVPRRSSKG